MSNDGSGDGSGSDSGPDWIFNLARRDQGIARKLGEGIDTRIFCGDHVMISIVHIEPHCSGRMHSHPEEQWGVLLEGECTRIQDGEEVAAKAGDFWRTPPNVVHGVRTGAVGAKVLDIFGPPRPEYKKAGEGFAA